MPAEPLLSIVIVNYNGLRFLDECLASIAKFVACSHEVIVVDNASADGSVAHLEANFPHIYLIKSTVNTGFTGGNNIGVRAASGELVLLLNNDTQLLNPIAPAVDAFANPRLGALGVHLLYGNGHNQPSVGYEHTPARIVLSWLGLATVAALPTLFRRTETAEAFYTQPHAQVAWVSGAFLLTRRALWDAIGGLDERYFMYVEDVDYCKQVRLKGYDVAYLPDVNVTHYEGAGKAWIGQGALTRTVRSYKLYITKHYGATVAELSGALLACVFGLRVPVYVLRHMLRGHTIDQEKAAGYAAAAKQALARQAITPLQG
jgi:N-acetylglucosaminyl-diphospho-decaprenol L-rhamnosyltransferase